MAGIEIEYLVKERKISQEEMRQAIGQIYSEKDNMLGSLTVRARSPGHLLTSYIKGAVSYAPKGETVNTGDLLTTKPEIEKKQEYLSYRWYHRFTSFFKIGYGYDWEDQYKEYKNFWENYFNRKQVF